MASLTKCYGVSIRGSEAHVMGEVNYEMLKHMRVILEDNFGRMHLVILLLLMF